MKVLLVNGSGHAKGCTYTALEEVAGALEKNGIETEIIQVGVEPIAGCIICGLRFFYEFIDAVLTEAFSGL